MHGSKEVTLGLLARTSRFQAGADKHTRSPGYIPEFLTLVLAPLLDTILANGVKVITNAGGLDPVGLKRLIEAHAKRAGLGARVRVAAVYGDDLMDQKDNLLRAGKSKGFDPLNGAGREEPVRKPSFKLLSLNAYTGAEPITEALRQGANIVVTGRCVDSASVLGALAYEHKWDVSAFEDTVVLDHMAAASLAGHILECGAQATGGNFTDWRLSAYSAHGGWANMGYPILTFYDDGRILISKPSKTGGIVTCHSVAEQMLYEVLDPANYILPDVVMDLTNVKLTQTAQDEVCIEGVKGKPPTPFLKCTAISWEGYRINSDFLIWGVEAAEKGYALGRAILERTNRLISFEFGGKVAPLNPADTNIMVVGADHGTTNVSSGSSGFAREIVIRILAKHEDQRALRILSQEISSMVTGSAPGITVFVNGRPRSGPNLATASVLVERSKVKPMLVIGDEDTPIPLPFRSDGCQPVEPSKAMSRVCKADMTSNHELTHSLIDGGCNKVRLIDVAIGRSGDKGDSANVAFIARHPVYYSTLLEQVTPKVIHLALAHVMGEGSTITRYEMPGVSAVNFVITECLGGGGLSSLSLDK